MRVLALFDESHMHYGADRQNDESGEPSLTEMTKKAIAVLKQNDNGFLLMVEGGRIDHAHHAGNAYNALNDTIELSNAVRAAIESTDPSNTLIVVTADLERETARLIRGGWIQATVVSQPVEMARLAIRLAADASEGKGIAQTTYTQPSLVTEATIDAVDLSGQFVPEDWK